MEIIIISTPDDDGIRRSSLQTANGEGQCKQEIGQASVEADATQPRLPNERSSNVYGRRRQSSTRGRRSMRENEGWESTRDDRNEGMRKGETGIKKEGEKEGRRNGGRGMDIKLFCCSARGPAATHTKHSSTRFHSTLIRL
ncbi:hypothetical protein ABW21_db0200907 [Orbilia brochopaga]|nr:hypothetical protein ABW21_db0200907 [Drechslerella brochopaga]